MSLPIFRGFSPHRGVMQVVNAKDGTVRCVPPRSKVAIVAAGRTTLALAPLSDSAWEIWSCNSLWHLATDAAGLFRAERWFELHPMFVQTTTEMVAMRQCPVPLYTLDYEPTIKQSVKFPLDQIRQMVGDRDYFACTFAYQIALAILEGFTDLGIYGIELQHGTPRERLVEKACVDWWLGYAQGRGMKIHYPEGCGMAWHPKLYGYNYADEMAYSEGEATAIARLWQQENKKIVK